MTERRWTIYVCPNGRCRPELRKRVCNCTKPNKAGHRSGIITYEDRVPVEVCPVGSPAEGDRELRGAACEALDALEGYLQGESGLPFTEPYGAARKAAGYLRAALGKTDGEETSGG